MRYRLAAILAAVVTLSACASSSFQSTWKAPDAVPLKVSGSKVAAVVMMRSEASRRVAEDSLAREITARGAEGISMYTLLSDTSPTDEAEARAALERAGVEGVVVIRPIRVSNEVRSTPMTYAGPLYGGYWGGYYGHGWGAPWGVGPRGDEIRTDTIVSVEILVYSLRQNKLVWGGQSRTTNTRDVDTLVRKLAGAAAEELQKHGLIAQSQALAVRDLR